MTLFQLVFVPVCATVMAFSAWRTATARVPRRSGLLWTLIWAAAAAFIAWPQTTTGIASWLGIGRGADLVFYLTTLGGLAAPIYFYLRQRRFEVLLTDVMRRQAIHDASKGSLPDGGSIPSATGPLD
jgi:hypothetical protein